MILEKLAAYLVSHGATINDVERLILNDEPSVTESFENPQALAQAVASIETDNELADWGSGLRRVLEGKSLFWDEYRIRRDASRTVRPNAPRWVHQVFRPLNRQDPIARNIGSWAIYPAIIQGSRKIRYSDLDEHADRLAGFLDHINKEPGPGNPSIQPGKVGMYFLEGNRPEALEIMLASKRANVPYTPFSKYLDPETMITDIVHEDYRVLFVDRKGLEAIEGEFGGLYLRNILVVLVGEEEFKGVMSYNRIINHSRRPGIVSENMADSDDLEAILFTSGTTGKPKQIERSALSLRMNPAFGVDQTDHLLVMADLFHGGYIRWANEHLFHGAAVYLAPPGAPMDHLLDTIEQKKITSLLLAPVLLRRMLQTMAQQGSVRQFDSLRRVAVIGAPFPSLLKAEAIGALGRKIFWDVFATTEYGEITLLSPDEMGAHMDTVGRAVEGVQIEIRGSDGKPLPAGEIGNIYVQTPFTDGIFAKTDDDGSLDAEGYLRIAGRHSDLILSRGTNFYSSEIEAAMQQIPQIAEVAVMGVEHPAYGEEIVAAVVLTEGISVTEEWVKNKTKELLYDGRAAPKRVIFLTALPRNTAGKVIRPELKAAIHKALESVPEAPMRGHEEVTGNYVHLPSSLPKEIPALFAQLYGKELISREQMALWSHAMGHLDKAKHGRLAPFCLCAAALYFQKQNEIEFFVSRVIDGSRLMEAYRETARAFRSPEPAATASHQDQAIVSIAAGLGWREQKQGKFPTLERHYRHVSLAADGRLFGIDFLYGHKNQFDILILNQFLNDPNDPRRLTLSEALPSIIAFADGIPEARQIIFDRVSATLPHRSMQGDYRPTSEELYPKFDVGLKEVGEHMLSVESNGSPEIAPVTLHNGKRILVIMDSEGIRIHDPLAGPLITGIFEKDLETRIPSDSIRAERSKGVVYEALHAAEPNDQFQKRILKARENELAHGLTTAFSLPARDRLILPDDEAGKKRLADCLGYLTRQLHERFSQNPAYARPLNREAIEQLTRDRSLLEITGDAALPAVNPDFAFYAGSFDPVTNGHLEMIAKASRIYKKVYVGIATNSNKTYKYPAEKRRQLVLDSLQSVGLTDIEVVIFPTSTPTVKVASQLGAGTMVRGARDAEDLKYEMVLAWTNQVMDSRIQSVLLTPSRYGDVSSSRVKSDSNANKDISSTVPGPVFWEFLKEELQAMPARPRLVGLVGGIGSGKSSVRALLGQDKRVLTADFDHLWHELMERPEIIDELTGAFGKEILTDGAVDRIKLRRVFEGTQNGQTVLNAIARHHVMRHAAEQIRAVANEGKGVHTVVFEGFGIVNSGMLNVLDQMIFVDTPEEERIRRALLDPNRQAMNREHVARVIASQKDILSRARAAANHIIDNSGQAQDLEKQVESIRSDITRPLTTASTNVFRAPNALKILLLALGTSAAPAQQTWASPAAPEAAVHAYPLNISKKNIPLKPEIAGPRKLTTRPVSAKARLKSRKSRKSHNSQNYKMRAGKNSRIRTPRSLTLNRL